MSVTVKPVESKQELKDFIYLPRRIYRGNGFWIPPIWSDEKKSYDRSKNPILAQSDYQLYIAYRGGIPAARAIAYIDHAFNDFFATEHCLFGAFESTNDMEAGSSLLEGIENWGRERGMGFIRGPIHPLAECWGFLLEGFDKSPVFMAPYNPPFYHDICLSRGYLKVKDLLAMEANGRTGYTMPARFLSFYDHFFKRNERFSVRPIRTKNILEDAEHIWHISNEGYRSNWGYVPVNREVMLDMVKKLKPIVSADAIWFVEDRGEPVAYCLGFPDINIAIKKSRGRLFPFGFLRLLAAPRTIRDYRLFGLAVLPAYHGYGLDVLLYVHLYQHLKPRNVRLEANYILEDNYMIRNALTKLGMQVVSSYRIYEKGL